MTYSLESTIAEKFDAILQRFELTGRMKDDSLEFEVVIAEIQTFIEPVFGAIVNEEEWKNIGLQVKDGTCNRKWTSFKAKQLQNQCGARNTGVT